MNTEIFIKFENQSQDFCLGVEYGRILQKIQDNNDFVTNDGFPIRLENVKVIKTTCEKYNYIPFFGMKYYNEWIDFIAFKNNNLNN